MPKKTGVCINIGGNCPKAKNREIQTADVTNFKCEHCGRELREKSNGGGGINTKLIAAIASGILVLGGIGGGFYKYFHKSDSDTEVKKTVVTPKEDTPENTNLLSKPTNGTDLGYAVWTGQVDENGLPNDTNGRMYFNERHRISPNDDQERYAEIGESIVGEYVNGKLVQGKWYKKDGNVEVIMMGM
ncbi:hypothetical protein [Parabacteroides johnsonii]|uniref:hypothetical protein n=1 Tax=Parabacteroides johnsonii TaxID=387661 RepID=UPI003AB3282B